MEVLGTILAALLERLLQWWANRKDIRDTERARLALEAAALAKKAMDYKVWTSHDTARRATAARLRVVEGGGRVESVPGDDAGPDQRTS